MDPCGTPVLTFLDVDFTHLKQVLACLPLREHLGALLWVVQCCLFFRSRLLLYSVGFGVKRMPVDCLDVV